MNKIKVATDKCNKDLQDSENTLITCSLSLAVCAKEPDDGACEFCYPNYPTYSNSTKRNILSGSCDPIDDEDLAEENGGGDGMEVSKKMKNKNKEKKNNTKNEKKKGGGK